MRALVLLALVLVAGCDRRERYRETGELLAERAARCGPTLECFK